MLNLEKIEEVLLATGCTLERVCAELAKLFGVRRSEIGVLRLDGEFLEFVYPPELQAAGRIPLSASAVAARTASTKRPEFFNNFAVVPHRTVFELVKLSDPELAKQEHLTIQKLMSAPIFGERNEVIGVIQVSRKGITPAAAGPDFSEREVRDLERTARRLAALKPEILAVNLQKPRWRLELQNEQKKRSRMRPQRNK